MPAQTDFASRMSRDTNLDTAEVGGDVGDLDFTTPNGSDDRTLKKARLWSIYIGCFCIVRHDSIPKEDESVHFATGFSRDPVAPSRNRFRPPHCPLLLSLTSIHPS